MRAFGVFRMSDGETISICPECGSADLRRRSRGDRQYYCGLNGHVFPEPDTREREYSDDFYGLDGLAKRLLEADPDDVGAG